MDRNSVLYVHDLIVEIFGVVKDPDNCTIGFSESFQRFHKKTLYVDCLIKNGIVNLVIGDALYAKIEFNLPFGVYYQRQTINYIRSIEGQLKKMSENVMSELKQLDLEGMFICHPKGFNQA